MKHDLSNVTFVIPYHRDSDDREENFHCIIKYLFDNFETNIVVVEEGKKHPMPVLPIQNYDRQYKFVPYHIDGIFYRTKVINEGIKLVKTPYLCIYDADVIMPPEQYVAARDRLLGSDVVYPYGGHFYDIDRSYIKDGIIKEHRSYAVNSVGGAVFMRTDIYWEAGLENQNIVGWGHEDNERYKRMQILEYNIARVDGPCYHISHQRGINSSNKNPYDAANAKEWDRIRMMRKNVLQEEIKSWTWCQR